LLPLVALLLPLLPPELDAAATCIMTPFKLEWLELWDKVLGLDPNLGAPKLVDPEPEDVEAAEGVSAPVRLLPVDDRCKGMGMMVVPDLVLIPLVVENLDRAELGLPVGPGKFNPPSATACRLVLLIRPDLDLPVEVRVEDVVEVKAELAVAPPSVLRRFRRLASSSSSGTVSMTDKTTPSSSSS
jgi:hypothetical protein